MTGEPVVRIRATSTGDVDDYGNPVVTITETTLTGTAFDPGGSREPVEIGREQVVTTPKLYFLSEPDLLPTDRVRVRGVEFEVASDPAVWRSPWTGFGGTVVELVRAAN